MPPKTYARTTFAMPLAMIKMSCSRDVPRIIKQLFDEKKFGFNQRA
jgi:hypothetical protein